MYRNATVEKVAFLQLLKRRFRIHRGISDDTKFVGMSKNAVDN
jgi:hypothetical protein